MQHLLCHVFYIGIFLRYLAPKEHAHLVRVKLAVEHLHDFLGNVAAAAVVLDVVLAMPLLRVVKHRLGSCQLYASEASVVDVTLHLQNP